MKLVLNDKRKTFMTRKNLVILTRTTNTYFHKTAYQLARDFRINLIFIDPHKIDLPLEGFIESKAGLLPSPSKTILWNRVSGTTYNDYDQLVTRNWQDLGATLLNSPNAHFDYRDKFNQFLHLKRAGVPLVETYYLPNLQIELIPENGPFVAKTLRGAKGKGVVRLEDKVALHDFLTLINSMGDNRFIIQPLINYQDEHRVFVLKNEIIGHFIKRRTSNNWKHNLEHTEWSLASELSAKMLKIVSIISKLEDKFFFAIDFILKNDDLKVLEVNICPGIEGPDALLEQSILTYALRVM
jgi:ribosomal protein S6--L-glutamate ligase